jgi:hypothetical protein
VSTIQANATKIIQYAANIDSAMTFVIEIREITPALINQFVYTIPNENWTWTIKDEVPAYDEFLYVIPNENWTYTITEETREFSIDEETRVYNIRSS